MGEVSYDVQQVCMNGHQVTARYDARPEERRDHCTLCGQATIAKCTSCKRRLEGRSVAPYGVSTIPKPPAYCGGCGKALPWTQARTDALAEMVEELDGLKPAEREKLQGAIQDIIADTPRSGTAVLLFKKAAASVGSVAGKLLMDVLGKVATEAVKTGLGL